MLQNIRLKVIQQLSKSANYACVETLERSYERSTRPVPGICNSAADGFNRTEIMHDRLRLNLAVSRGAEIFSWHGEDKFISHDVSKVVHGGPISSGSFVGFLENIFVDSGILFTARGISEDHGVKVVRYDYKVTKDRSRFRMQASGPAFVIAPFHGSFWANVATAELTRLKIVADDIPFGFEICSTESEVHYQIADISGVRTLIPRSYELEIDDSAHLHTVSRGEYTQCHEFQAQSKLSFDPPAAGKPASARPNVERWLPAGLKLDIALASSIDSKKAFTGDAVEGVLESPVSGLDGEKLLPAGARVRGVITQLEKVYAPQQYQSLRIEFGSVSFGAQIYFMRTAHVLTDKEKNVIRSIYGTGASREEDQDTMRQGIVLFRTSHLRLDSRYRGQWLTLSPRP